MLASKEHDGEEFKEASLTNEDLSGHRFENCVFTSCNLSGAKLSHARFLDCRFDNCDLSNVALAGARMRDVAFENCKLVGASWIHLSDLTGPLFRECNLSYSNFSGLKLKKTTFEKSLLRECDFAQADLSECDFRGCDFTRARFDDTNLAKADLRHAIQYAIDPLRNKVRGAKFSLPEAQSLLLGLGITLE